MLGKVCPHPNIVTLHEADLDAETPYLVFEYIPGGELRDHCRNLQSEGQQAPLRDFFRSSPSAMPGAGAGPWARDHSPGRLLDSHLARRTRRGASG